MSDDVTPIEADWPLSFDTAAGVFVVDEAWDTQAIWTPEDALAALDVLQRHENELKVLVHRRAVEKTIRDAAAIFAVNGVPDACVMREDDHGVYFDVPYESLVLFAHKYGETINDLPHPTLSDYGYVRRSVVINGVEFIDDVKREAVSA